MRRTALSKDMLLLVLNALSPELWSTQDKTGKTALHSLMLNKSLTADMLSAALNHEKLPS
jgi:ankyrin repeat protein